MRSIVVFVVVLVALNVLFRLVHLDFRISIIGSLLVSALVSGVIRRRPR